jgi:L-fuculose-phosphate aldolase
MIFLLLNFLAIKCEKVCEIKHCSEITDIKEQIEYLEDMTANHYLLKHNFLMNFSEGNFIDMEKATKVFAENHYTYSNNFIKFLQMTIKKIDDEHIKNSLEDNVDEESGNYEEEDLKSMEKIGYSRELFDKIKHRDLVGRFLNSVGIDTKSLICKEEEEHDDENEHKMICGNHPGGTFTEFMYKQYKSSSTIESLSIIGFAIERTVSTIYSYILKGIQQTQLEKKDYVFFPLHIYIDDGHADLLIKGTSIYLEKNPSEFCNLVNIVNNTMNRRVQMYDEINNILSDLLINSNSYKIGLEQSNKLIKNNNGQDRTNLEKLVVAAKTLFNHGHSSLSGQITVRDQKNTSNFWVNIYGYAFNEYDESKFVLVDQNLNVLQNNNNIIVSAANQFNAHIYAARSDINAIIHTHPMYTTALSMIGENLEIGHMDYMALYDDVSYLEFWPGIPFDSTKEGPLIVKTLKNKNNILLASHGLISVGKTIEEALYRAIHFELAAKAQILALSTGKKIKKTHRLISEEARNYRISQGPVNRHFEYFARGNVLLI